MFIKTIILDGFKSYAQRTEISGFDPLFNAVTGLNGSGKSNILDGICFVLGITNLSQVSVGVVVRVLTVDCDRLYIKTIDVLEKTQISSFRVLCTSMATLFS